MGVEQGSQREPKKKNQHIRAASSPSLLLLHPQPLIMERITKGEQSPGETGQPCGSEGLEKGEGILKNQAIAALSPRVNSNKALYLEITKATVFN